MARPLLLSNGELHVGLNKFSEVHDLYFPYVGLENHAAGHQMRHKIGVWVEDEFSWLDDGNWEFLHDYPHRSLIGHTRAFNGLLGVVLEIDSYVDAQQTALIRHIHIINSRDRARQIKLYMHQVFAISENLRGDTVQYLPGKPVIMHYKGHRVFMISGEHADKRPFDEFSTGLYKNEGHEGTYKDAEDGKLSGNYVEHGNVDSVISYTLECGAHDSARVYYWLAAGKSYKESLAIHNRIKREGPESRLIVTNEWWRKWLEPAEPSIKKLPADSQAVFRKSLMIVKSHIDKRGAVMASTDTTMLNYWRDAYAYCWTRDASFVLWPLLRLGYKEEITNFFGFCRRVIHPDGYLQHKFQSDGALGSSWHPFVYDNMTIPPIQEDETASVLFLIGQYYRMYPKDESFTEVYEDLVRPMANFMAQYIDNDTRLPKPSYDLWEEKYLTSTYTTAIVYAALITATHLADRAHADQDAVRWQTVADEMKKAASTHLYNENKGYFYKGFIRKEHSIEWDETIDVSSFYGAFMFGLFDTDDPKMTKSFKTIKDTFALHEDGAEGVPRYEHDQYNIVDPASQGNPWFITTLWVAQYYIEINHAPKAAKYLKWVVNKAMTSGVISEQMNPYTNSFLSVSVAPLAWSQAELLNTYIDMFAGPPDPGDI